MTRFLADEHVSHHLVRAVRRIRADIDLTTVQQLSMAGATDDEVLDRGVAEGRVVLTSDRNTMLGIRNARVEAGAPAPGIVVMNMLNTSFRAIAEDIVFLAEAAEPRDWANPIFVPLS